MNVGGSNNIFSLIVKVDQSIILVFPFFCLLHLIALEKNIVEDNVLYPFKKVYFILVPNQMCCFCFKWIKPLLKLLLENVLEWTINDTFQVVCLNLGEMLHPAVMIVVKSLLVRGHIIQSFFQSLFLHIYLQFLINMSPQNINIIDFTLVIYMVQVQISNYLRHLLTIVFVHKLLSIQICSCWIRNNLKVITSWQESIISYLVLQFIIFLGF